MRQIAGLRLAAFAVVLPQIRTNNDMCKYVTASRLACHAYCFDEHKASFRKLQIYILYELFLIRAEIDTFCPE